MIFEFFHTITKVIFFHELVIVPAIDLGLLEIKVMFKAFVKANHKVNNVILSYSLFSTKYD